MEFILVVFTIFITLLVVAGWMLKPPRTLEEKLYCVGIHIIVFVSWVIVLF